MFGTDSVETTESTSSAVANAHRHFPFPFEPWSIQHDFMTSLYDGIEGEKILIMESPTGTGKSLSLLCGSLQWQQDFQAVAEKQALEAAVAKATGTKDEPDWVLDHIRSQIERTFEETRERKRKRDDKLRQIRQGGCGDLQKIRAIKKARQAAKTESDEEEELLVDYKSGDEKNSAQPSDTLDFPPPLDESQDLLEEEEQEETLKIIYCSRTHSQISQFVREMKKTAFTETKTVSLGSRKTMCINERVRSLGSVARMNDECLEMMKGKGKQKNGCQYLTKDPDERLAFTAHVHSQIHDIEEIVELGRKHETCPYFGARDAVRTSQVVTVPYNILLQKSARESVGINLKGNVVVIDEAHNLIDAIVSTHSVSVDLKQISQSIFQLTSYLDRYRRRLRGRNVIYISQLRDILHSLERVLSGSERAKDASTTNAKAAVVTVNDFVHNLGIDNINLYKVEKYLQESKLAQKLQGFVEKNAQTKKKADQSTDEQEFTPKHVSAIRFVESFVMSMTNADLEGRVMVDYAGKTLKYLLLNPSNCFRPIIEEARAVVLAGGTMEPVSELVDELFSYIPPTRLARFSCGHIIPPSSLLCLTVSKGPRSEPFSFTYENRGSSSMLNDLGAAIINLCNVTPGGVICFLSSYDILDQIVDGWGTSGVLTRISAKKQVFKEPRTSEMVDEVLQGYAQSIKMTEEHRVGQTGAILFAVVGGKMSEGINFSDNMGRLVIMVGLPFPNLFAADLQEKLRYIKTRAAATGKSNKEIEECASGYYENTCMKAVNQSIGRVIRHKDDYAAIVLLDHRYAQPRIKNKLPGWIRDAGIEDCTEFGKVVGKVAVFFRAKRVLKG